MTVVADDLFAGAGGWDLAARRLGVEARGVENMPAARATRDAAGLVTIHDDVWTYQPDGKATGLIASPPCQTFSQAGKGAGRRALDTVLAAIDTGAYKRLDDLRDLAAATDDRTGLVLTPLHYAVTSGYRWLAWEQVKAVQPVWDACAAVLRDLGWSVWTGRLHAEQYGVPQTRTRSFLFASLDREVRPPVPTHSRYHTHNPARLDDGVPPWVSMAEALGWGLTERPAPTITGGGTDTGGAEPITHIVERWTTRPDWCFRRPATTVVGTFRPDIIAAPGYRTVGGPSRQDAPDSVRVTVAEAATLQAFPDHPWQGAEGKQYLQVGNAVPPLLAQAGLGVVL